MHFGGKHHHFYHLLLFFLPYIIRTLSMTRKKINLAFMENENARKATFKKRKTGLMKKVNELSTLCGVDACAIVYSPFTSEPEVWPSRPEVERVITKFRNMPELEKTKKNFDQEKFTQEQVEKLEEKVNKQQRGNRNMEVTEIMYRCLRARSDVQNLRPPDMSEMAFMLSQTVADAERRVLKLKNELAQPDETRGQDDNN